MSGFSRAENRERHLVKWKLGDPVTGQGPWGRGSLTAMGHRVSSSCLLSFCGRDTQAVDRAPFHSPNAAAAAKVRSKALLTKTFQIPTG